MFRVSSLLAAAALAASPVIIASAASGAKQDSPARVLQLSVSAMREKGSFRFVSTASYDGVVAVRVTTDSSLTYGVHVQSFDGGTETTRLIGKSLYMYADEKAYSADFGLKHSSLADQWVLVPPSNANYANMSSAILVPSVMQQLVDIDDLKEVGVANVNGQEALELRGNAGESGTETIYVSTASPYLPIAVSAVSTQDGERVTDELVFSRWGEKFKVAAPASYVVATKSTFP